MMSEQSLPTRSFGLRTPVQKRSRAAVKSMVDATRSLLNEVTLDELTMQGVAERAGVSVGSIYRYFEHKGDLLRAVQDRALEELEISAMTRLAAAEPTVEAVVLALVSALDEVSAERAREFSAFLVQVGADPGLTERARAAHFVVLRAFQAALARDRARIAHEDIDWAARVALEIVVGLFIWYTHGQIASLRLDEAEPKRDLVVSEARRAAVVYLLQPDP